ncbi:MAG: hypothetical protein Kow0062_16280 [Acidobacteriota bacterium]
MSTDRVRLSRWPVGAALAVLLAAGGAVSTATAQEQEDKNLVRVGGSYAYVVQSTTRVSSGDLDELEIVYTFDDGSSPFLSWERRISAKTGLELSVARIDLDLAARTTRTMTDPNTFEQTVTRGMIGGSTTITPIELALVHHPGSHERWDFYFGAMLAYVLYDDLVHDASPEIRQLSPQLPDDTDTVALDNKLGWGVLVGLDWNTRADGPWRLSFSARRLFTRAVFSDPDADLEIDIDPWEWRLGVGYRF